MSAREHPIGFMADRLETAQADIRRLHPDALFTKQRHGVLDGYALVPQSFVILIREEDLRGVELSDVRWLPHARMTGYRDELARTRLR